MTPTRKALSWFACGGALAAAVVTRLLSVALYNAYVENPSYGPEVRSPPAFTLFFTSHSWWFFKLPIILAAVSAAASAVILMRHATPERTYRAVVAIAALVLFTCAVVGAADFYALYLLPRRNGSI